MIALAEEHLVIPPAQRHADGAVAPPDNCPTRAARPERQRIDGNDLKDNAVGDHVIVRPDKERPHSPSGGMVMRLAALVLPGPSIVRGTQAKRTSVAPAATSARIASLACAPVVTTSSISSTELARTEAAAR